MDNKDIKDINHQLKNQLVPQQVIVETIHEVQQEQPSQIYSIDQNQLMLVLNQLYLKCALVERRNDNTLEFQNIDLQGFNMIKEIHPNKHLENHVRQFISLI